MSKSPHPQYERSTGYTLCEGMVSLETAEALAARSKRAEHSFAMARQKAEYVVQEIRCEHVIAKRDAAQCELLLRQHKKLPVPCVKFLLELYRGPRPRYVQVAKVPPLLMELGFVVRVPNTLGFLVRISPSGKQKLQTLGLIPRGKKVKP